MLQRPWSMMIQNETRRLPVKRGHQTLPEREGELNLSQPRCWCGVAYHAYRQRQKYPHQAMRR